MSKVKVKKESFSAINSQEFLAKIRSNGPEMNNAFRMLVDITHNPLLFYIKRYIFSNEEAQEVLQDVYLGIFKGIHNFQEKSKLSTWIYSLTHNKVCDKISDKKWQHEEYSEFKENASGIKTEDSQVSRSTEWNTTPDKLAAINQVQDQIPEIVQTLSANLKEVYLMRDVEGLDSGEVAQILGITEEAVRVRLHRARNTIVEKMKKSLEANFNAPLSKPAKAGTEKL